MNVSNKDLYTLKTRRHFPEGAGVIVWPIVGLLMTLVLMWLGATLWPVIRGCLA